MKPLKYRPAAFLLENKLDPDAVERAFQGRPMSPSAALEYVNRANVKVAVVQLLPRSYRSLGELVEHLQSLVKDAQQQGAQLISFPEYTGLLPLFLSPTFRELIVDFLEALEERDLEECQSILSFYRTYLSELVFSCYYNLFALLAHGSRLYIHAGSTLLYEKGGFHERCFLFGPEGNTVLEQDKLFLSELEQALGILPGEELELCDSPLGRIAILPGQDSNFFEGAKAARQLGAELLLCPVTPVLEEKAMVERCGPWMRCQEQNFYALVSRLISQEEPYCFRGKAAILAPCEATRNKDGIVLQSNQPEQEQILCSRINLDYLELPLDYYAADSNPELAKKLAAAYEKL